MADNSNNDGNDRWFNDRRFNFVRGPQQLTGNLNRLLADLNQFYRQNPELIAPIRQQVQIIADITSGNYPNTSNNNQIEQNNIIQNQVPPHRTDSVAVDIDLVGQNSDTNGPSVSESNEPSAPVEPPQADNNPPPAPPTPQDDWQQLMTLIQGPEIQALLRIVCGFVPFLIILFAKFFLNHFFYLVNILILMVSFFAYDICVKNLITDRSTLHRCRCLSLLGSVWFCILGVVMFMISILGEDTALCIVTSFPLLLSCPAPDLCMVLYLVVAMDLIIKYVFMTMKVLLALTPSTNKGFMSLKWKRQVYQLLEFTSRCVRIVSSCRPWTAYIVQSHSNTRYARGVAYSLLSIYAICKLFRLVPALQCWKNAAMNTLRPFPYGYKPSIMQIQKADNNCSICFTHFTDPVALDCQHVFCEDCITTWLDKESTCPICRAFAKTPDTAYKNGATERTFAVF